MCDERTFHEDETFLAAAGKPSRRAFTAMSAAALAACATPPANALDVAETDVRIATPDGEADAYFVAPAQGKHPGVLFWPDIFGLRPATRAMGKRLAQSGYAVLVVNQFYRDLRGPALREGETFEQPEARQRLFGLYAALTPDRVVRDALAHGAFLDAQASLDTRRKIGVQGYCMGGPISFRTAAALPGRVGAVASFHGGGLVTDQPESPHRLIAQTQARYLVAVAANDDQQRPTDKDTLRAAFDAAGRPAEIEVYPAQHGWCPPDNAVYDPIQAERAWARLLALYSAALT